MNYKTPVLNTESDYKFEGVPIGFHERIEWMAQGVYVVVLGAGGQVQVKARDELTPPDFGDQFLTIEDTKSTALRLMFAPAIEGFGYYASMDKSNVRQPPMFAYLMVNGDYTLRYATKDYGLIANEKVLEPGQLWADSYFWKTSPKSLYATDFVNARLGMVRVSV